MFVTNYYQSNVIPCVAILIPKHSFCNTVCPCMVMQIKLVVVVVPSAYCASFSQSFETKNLAVILITLLVLNFTILGETIIFAISIGKYEKLNFAIHTFSGSFYLSKTLNFLKFP